MKTILLASMISFVVIFGGVFLYAQRVSTPPSPDRIGNPLDPDDVDAAELSLAALATERAQIADERQQLLELRRGLSQRENHLREQLELITASIESLREEQERYGQARSASAQKLAKMFDAMKANAAAPIFSSLDRETALEILVSMKEKSAAKLLSAIDPGLAADLSTKLSLRGVAR